MEIRSHFAINREKLGNVFDFATRLPLGADRLLINFLIEVATHLTFIKRITIILGCIITISGASEEEISIDGSKLAETLRFNEVGEAVLEGEGKESREGAVSFADLAHAFAVRTANDVGGVMPEAGFRVDIETANLDSVFSGNKAKNSTATITKLERSGEDEVLPVKGELVGGDETAV